MKATSTMTKTTKIIDKTGISESELSVMRSYYEKLRLIDSVNILKIYEYEDIDQIKITIETCDWITLDTYTGGKKIAIRDFLNIAIQLANILAILTKQNVIHGNINPSSILINNKTGIIKISEFGDVREYRNIMNRLTQPNIIKKVLPYFSPEQTGRINIGIDYRTDFYSLGIVLYKLATGELPFNADDALELIHAHIAKIAITPQKMNSSIPEVISEIIMKLMDKEPGTRYQSGKGLLHDLNKCMTRLDEAGKLENFDLGKKDNSHKFEIPPQLYGRKEELRKLFNGYSRASAGSTEFTLIAGYSGIGKTRLVSELYKPIANSNGYFTTGKYDQFQKNIPYSAIIRAFQGLIKQILSEDSNKVARWKKKLQDALGINGQVIVDVIPEIELIMGNQSAVPELGPVENKHRFKYVFEMFIQVFTRQDHPLTLFIDDMQWADSASLKLIETILASSPDQHFYLLGAYRNNEVDAAHPLMITLESLKKININVQTIILEPLTEEFVAQLIADTLACSDAGDLARIVYGKTRGNPFFVSQFMQALYTEKLISFDFEINAWTWELDKIESQNITENVVELMSAKIKKLPEKTQNILKLAACIGNKFDLNILSVVNEKNLKATASELWGAVEEGFILPVGNAYRELRELVIMESGDTRETSDLSFVFHEISLSFLHDKVQQAAYSLIQEAKKKELHLTIGRLLLKNTNQDHIEENIFDIVNHLNFSRELITSPAEKQLLTHLNFKAGIKAKNSTSYEEAFCYLQNGLELLGGKDGWESQYELSLKINSELAETAYLSGKYEETEIYAQEVIAKTKNLLDKISVYETMIHVMQGQNRLNEALGIGLEVLRQLGLTFPKKPRKLHIITSLLIVKKQLIGKSTTSLLELPEMKNPSAIAKHRIITSLATIVYFSEPNLAPLFIFELMKLSFKYGNSKYSPYGYGTYGFILCGILGDMPGGYQFGELAIKLVQKINAREKEAGVSFVFNVFVRHWSEHINTTISPFIEIYKTGMETGDIEYAAFAILVYLGAITHCSSNLEEIHKQFRKYKSAIENLKQTSQLNIINIYHQHMLNHLSITEDPGRLMGTAYNEEAMWPVHTKANDKVAIFALHTRRLMLRYLFYQYKNAMDDVKCIETIIASGMGRIDLPFACFYSSLTLLALYPEVSKSEQKKYLKRVDFNQKKIKKWSTHAPMNNLHKQHLVEAERMNVLGDEPKAIEYYDKAIDLAKINEYIIDQALANELAGKFYLKRNRINLAGAYIKEAHRLYSKWGSVAKIDHLENSYPDLIISSSKKTAIEPGSDLNMNSLLKVFQSISGEIELAKLLKKIIRIVVESSGAQKAIFIISLSSELYTKAQYLANDIELSQPIPLKESKELDISIVQYVARTKEDIILNDAANEDNYTNSDYINEKQPKSVLCIPVINQGRLLAILYLENNLTTHAFQPELTKLLKMIASQAAISLENAMLFESMEDKVKERTRDLLEANEQIKKQESMLIQQEKLAVLGDITASVAHEINTPLVAVQIGMNVIKSYINKTRSEYKKILSTMNLVDILEKDHSYNDEDMNIIETSLEQIRKQVQNMKSFIKFQDDKADFNVNEELDTTLNILNFKLLTDVDIEKEYDPGIPNINGNGAQMNQVFMNLIKNAAESRKPGERSRIKIKTYCEKYYLCIEITDNGVGIDATHLSKLFNQKFSTKKTGSGLGLAMCHDIIARHNGEIEVASNVNEGTKVTIKIKKTM